LIDWTDHQPPPEASTLDDPTRPPAGPSDPPADPAAVPPDGAPNDAAGRDGTSEGVPPPPGLGEQLHATFGAVRRVIQAHLDLARGELAEILGEVKRAGALGLGIVGLLLFAGLVAAVGSTLFLGDLIFGSIGWGVLHGVLGAVAIGVILGLVAIYAPSGGLVRAFAIAAAIGLVVTLVLGAQLSHRGWTALGDGLAVGFEPGVRPLAIAVLATACLLGLLGLLVGASRGRSAGAGIGGLVLGGLGGALLGALTAIAFGWRPAAALGVTVFLVGGPTLALADVYRRGVDVEALKNRFWPTATIETTKETIEWVRARTPLGPKS
jgi:hypothetical protein